MDAFTAEEKTKMKKAFEDPEFRELFTSYMDEIQDPKNREENEKYITQLELEDKVPKGKQLIRPQAGFVVKTRKSSKNSTDEGKDKVFINIVSSEFIVEPIQEMVVGGSNWSLPYSVGPPHMEKDNKHSNATCFDCCFHPKAIESSACNPQFKDLLIKTALEGVQSYYSKMQQDVRLDSATRVLKGVQYKSGPVGSMVISKSDSNDTWQPKSDVKASESSSFSKSAESPSGVSKSGDRSVEGGGMFRKGFLNSSGKRASQLSNPIGASSQPQPVAKDVSYRPQEKDAGSNEIVDTFHIDKLRMPYQSGSQEVSVSSKIQDVTDTTSSASGHQVDNKSLSTPVISSETYTSKGINSGLSEVQFTLVERGTISMGDFPSLGSQQPSSLRPAELVLRFQVPLAIKPSLLILDVAENVVKLSYLEVYAFSLPLPFPIFDKKGSAKYDKKTKILTVLLPVQPSLVTAVVNTLEHQTEVINAQTIGMETGTSIHSSSVKAFKVIDSAKQHSRWVQQPNVDGVGEEEMRRSQRLRESVALKAKEAKDLYAAQQNLLSLNAQTSSASGPDEICRSNNGVSAEFNDESFVACPQFVGHRPGYAFQTQEQGTGYYRDRFVQSIGCNEMEMPSADLDKAIAVKEFQYECRETLYAIAILVQVASIIPSSVCVRCIDCRLDISFQAIGMFDGLEKLEYYGMSFSFVCVEVDSAHLTADPARSNMAIVIGKMTLSTKGAELLSSEDTVKVEHTSATASAILSPVPFQGVLKPPPTLADALEHVVSRPFLQGLACPSLESGTTSVESPTSSAAVIKPSAIVGIEDCKVQLDELSLGFKADNPLFELF